jgi:adenylyltransferase/sulfurtransferase
MRLKLLVALLALLLAACNQPAAPRTTQPQSSAPAAAQQAVVSSSITPQELAARLQQPDRPFVLDVREPFEVEIATIPGTSALIPLGELSARTSELDPNEEIVIYCRSGNRSQQAVNLLQQAGFSNVRNLEGGIIGWSEQVDPSMPTY